MRVLFVCNSLASGGAESYVATLAVAFAGRGHEVCLASAQGSELFRLARETAGVTALEINIGPKLSRGSSLDMALRFPIYRRALRRKLRDWIGRYQVEIVHLQFKKEQIIASALAKRLGLAVVWTEHDRLPAPLAGFWPGLHLYLRASRFADQIICVADFVRKNMISHGLRKDLLTVCHNGIDPIAAGPASPTDLREQLGLDRQARIVATASRLAWTKGISNFLAAVPLIRRDFVNAQFLVIGDGPERKDLQDRARDLGISHNVVFAGHRNDVPAILEIVDVFVCPSLQEGFPFSILEAMRAGKPVVATRTGGVPELLRHDLDGLLVDVGDVDGLAAAIAQILRNRNLSSRFGRSGRARVLDSFSADTMINCTEAVLQRVLLG